MPEVEVAHAHLEELFLSQLLGTGKSKGSPPCNELRDRFIIPLLGFEIDPPWPYG